MKFKKESEYVLEKVAAHRSSPYGYADKSVIGRGIPLFMPDTECLYIALHDSPRMPWFRTSQVQRVLKIKGGYKFFTLNSTYTITEV
jgi:hypothetical protein